MEEERRKERKMSEKKLKKRWKKVFGDGEGRRVVTSMESGPEKRTQN